MPQYSFSKKDILLPNIPDEFIDFKEVRNVLHKLRQSLDDFLESDTEAKDEDDMASDSDVHLATQQSIKAYIESYPNTGNFDARVKAWIQFNGTGVIAIQDSFNVTSITDNGTGNYTINWDTDFANDDYAVVGQSDYHMIGLYAHAVGSVTMSTKNSEGTTVDSNQVSLIAIGDQ